ncbi:unnamed protein product [Linum tenue]|uniref:PTM/DIR17-like Tudor domain-containing protein n=1 Tax=Linum tenue TaxID=586396 RepID=A0AAV0PNI7_9ROSI|nr:unnamed protein product [Linum tenue]
MDSSRGKQAESPSSPSTVFKLPGEPAVIINGVPDIGPAKNDASVALAIVEIPEESQGTTAGFLGTEGFGDWLEGRKVRKLFGNKHFSGTVSRYDKETRWYRVVYEDGDFEDLEWKELEPVLLPLDITVPLKTLALKVVGRSQTVPPKVWKTGSATKARKKTQGMGDQIA